MALQFSQFQMTDAQHWSGLTTSNHLNSIFQNKPQPATDIMRRIHTTNYGMDLDSQLAMYPAKYLKTDDDFTWELIGSGKKNLPLIEARLTPTGSAVAVGDQAGAQVTSFYLIFPERIFTVQQTIVGHKNEAYQCQIVNDPVADGSNWRYEVRLITNDPDLFVPVDELAPGKRWSREWSLVTNTLSTRGGGIHFESPFAMRNTFTMIRMQHTMAGNMINRPFATKFKVNNPKTKKLEDFTTWMQYEDFVFDQQFRQEKNRLLMFARSNRATDGTYYNRDNNGHIEAQGAGIRQQMEASGTEYYSTFTIQLITDILMDLSEGKLPTDERHFVARTGERGAVQFHYALQDYAQLFVPSQETMRIFKSSENGGMKGVQGAMGYRGQFLEYVGPQGIKFSISVDSMYDDRERNKILHPDGGVAESYRYDIMDIGTNGGIPNVQKFYVEGSEDIWGYQPGLRDPFSPTGAKNRIMAHATDGYTVHRGTQCGVAVYDPSRTKSLIPSILA
jgi:hypothetical protein